VATMAFAGAASEMCAPEEPKCTGPATPYQYLAVLASEGYDKTERPSCGDGEPTIVDVQFYLTQVNNIDQKLGTMELSGYLRYWWNDPRLAFNGTKDGGCSDDVVLMGLDGNRIWVPDVFVFNAASRTTDGLANLTNVYPDGSVWRSVQTTILVQCKLDLGPLPYDKHVGFLKIASFNHGSTEIRLRPREGTAGPGLSGVALKGAAMTNNVWKLADGVEGEFKTPGLVEEIDGQDFLTMTFNFARKPKYFFDQVILPCVLFLLVSYIQVWVDPTKVPARAFLSVIPVLIMRTLSNSVYTSLPEGSQKMWLADCLRAFTIWTILGCVEFGLIQALRNQEASRAKKRAGLKAVDKEAKKLIQAVRDEQAVDKEASLLKLLDKCEAVKEERSGEQVKVASPEATKREIKETHMLFIRYLIKIFHKYDKNDGNDLSVSEVQKLMTFFDLYMSKAQTASVMCMFLRDQGFQTPKEEIDAHVNLSQTCGLLLDIDKYILQHGRWGLVELWQSSKPSERCDMLARMVIPVGIMLTLLILYLTLPNYETAS